MKPTDELKKEHQAIRLMLRILDQVCRRLEAREKVDPAQLERIVEFIQVFADRCHHGKEEDLLFKAMVDAGFPQEGGPIAVMMHEHGLGREYAKGLTDAVRKYRTDPSAAGRIVQNARNYILLLGQHIDKEDNILYPMADQHLSPAKQEELLRQFEDLEQQRIGPGKHEEFHRLLEQLRREYLPEGRPPVPGGSANRAGDRPG